MNIKIEKIFQDTVLEVSSYLGSLIVTSPNKKIEEGKTYSVEFDIKEDIQLGKNAEKVEGSPQFVRHKNFTNEIMCLVELFDDDGMCLRLGDDCIIVAESEDQRIKAGDYLLLMISLDKLQMTVIGYPPLR